MSREHVVVVTEPGSAVDRIVNFVMLNHGVARVTVTRPDGRTTTLSIAVDREDPDAHATLNQWSKH